MAEVYKLKPLNKRYYKQNTLVEEFKRGKQVKIGSQVGIRYKCGYMVGETCIMNDSNDEEGDPFRFKLGFVNIIEGWDFAICGMFVGGRRRITIPSSVGRGTPIAPWNKDHIFIPRGSDLVIDVEVDYIDV